MFCKNKKNKHVTPLIISGFVITAIIVAGTLLFEDLFPNREANASIPLNPETKINSATTQNNKTGSAIDDKGNTIVVWDSDGDNAIYYSRLNIWGAPLDYWGAPITEQTDIKVNSTTTGEHKNATVAMDKFGNYVITWESDHAGDYDIYVQAYRNDGTAIGGETLVNATNSKIQKDASISIDHDGGAPATGNNTRFVISWTTEEDDPSTDTDIKFQMFDVDFSGSSPPAKSGTETVVNSYTLGSQVYSSVAMNNAGEFIISWAGAGDGDSGVYYQIFDNDGTTVGTNTKINTETSAVTAKSATGTDKSPRPDALDSGDRRFVIAYEIFESNSDIAAKKITCSDTDDSPTGKTLNCNTDALELFVNVMATGSQMNPSLDTDYLGDFTVAWQDSNANGDTSGTGVMAQSYTYLGKTVNQNFLVNTSTTGNQTFPSVSMNTDGFYNISFTNTDDYNNYLQNYTTEIFKVQTEKMPFTPSGNSQLTADTAISPVGTTVQGRHAEVWTDYTTQDIYFTLREFDNDETILVDSVKINDTDTNADNPKVSFFKDTSGSGEGKFVIAWEEDDSINPSDYKEIYYRIYNADGTPLSTKTAVTSGSASDQTTPAIEAGIYDDGSTIEEITIGWVNGGTNIESAYYHTSLTPNPKLNSIDSCTGTCAVSVALNEDNNRVVYTYSSGDNIYARQLESGELSGTSAQITSGANTTAPDSAFIGNDQFIITYSKDISLSSGNVYAVRYQFTPNTPLPAPTGNPPISLTSEFLVSQYVSSTGAQAYSKVAGDKTNAQFLIVWTDFPGATAENHIFGQFYHIIGSEPVSFGPSFRINSTQEGDQTFPSVDLNDTGRAVIAWEGNINQPGLTDSNGIATQLIQNPLNTQTVATLNPVCAQEIQAGVRLLVVPENISFPDINLSTTEPQTQTVSIRDTTYGGHHSDPEYDGKYIEVQDALGGDFTLTVQTNDFISANDNKSYIKSNEHFKVRNWDQDLTGVNNPTNCDGDPDLCFTTETCSNPNTLFSLSSETTDFVFTNIQKVLATRNVDEGNPEQNAEIGRWKFYPEFEITTPPIIPPGEHSADITFTLT